MQGPPRKFSLYSKAVPVAVSALYALLLFLYCQNAKTVLDEDQFLAAAQLLGAYLPYRDYIYFQTPLYPVILAGLQEIFGESGIFFLARTASWAFGLGCLTLIHLIARCLSGSRGVAWAVTFLAGFSPLLLLGFSSARNDILPVFLGLCGLALALPFLQCRKEGKETLAQSTRLFISGVFLALAVATKLTAAFIPLVLLIALAVKVSRGRLAVFVLGGVFGSLPILFFAAFAPELFFLDVFAFHRSAPFHWYQEIGEAQKLEWGELKVVFASLLGQDPSLLLATVFAWSLLILAAARQRLGPLHQVLSRNGGYAIFALSGTGVLLCAQPKPHLVHYFIPLGPYILLSAAALTPLLLEWLESKSVRSRHAVTAVFALLCLVTLTSPQARLVLLPEIEAFDSASWVTSKVRAASERIAASLRGKTAITPLAGLNPIYLVDANLPLMPEFASSIFFYRTADHETPETARKVKGISPSLTTEILDAAQPSAILIGEEFPFLSAPLLEWALKSGYSEAPPPGEGLRLFLRPERQSVE